MSARYYLACDLGAESGRVMLGRLEDGRVALEEIHRFATVAVRLGDSLRWDVLRLWDDIRVGLRKALARGVAHSGGAGRRRGVRLVGRDATAGADAHRLCGDGNTRCRG